MKDLRVTGLRRQYIGHERRVMLLHDDDHDDDHHDDGHDARVGDEDDINKSNIGM